jgi:hypothetical protein
MCTSGLQDSVRGRIAEIRRAKVVVGQPVQVFLDADLRDTVGRNRRRRAVLGHEIVACRAIETAGRREEESRHPGLSREAGKSDRREMVDVERTGRVEVSQRVVAQARQVNDRVEPTEVSLVHVSDVLFDRWHRRELLPEQASSKQIGVEPNNPVTGRDQ